MPSSPALSLPFARRAARRPRPRAAAALACAALLAGLLGGCASGPGGGASTDADGPPAAPPADLAGLPDAVPRVEPIRIGGPNKPYEVLGRRYAPETRDVPLREEGLASWYGRRFHGRRTASGELFDMYAMTAAHKTMPLPSYARIRNPANGREVVVRINDRGPFHRGRIVDLSYAAAVRLGVQNGVAKVELERLTHEDIRSGAWRRRAPGDGTAVAGAAPAVPAEAVRPVAARGESAAAGGGALPVASAPRPAKEAVPAPGPQAAGGNPGAEGEPEPRATPAAAATEATPPVAPVRTGAAAATVDSAQGGGDASAAIATAAGGAAPLATGAAAGSAEAAPVAEGPSLRATTPAARGFWVQLGAFRERGGALDFHRRVAGELEGLAPLMAVSRETGLFRVQAGPYASRDEAQDAAQRIRDALRLVPLIVERR